MGLGAYDYYGAQQQQQKQAQQPSPYATLGASSAGNPASSYGSSGGAQAGPWGTQAPTYSAPVQTYAQQKAQQGQQVTQGAQSSYRAPTGYPTYTYQSPQAQAPPSFKLPGGGVDQQALTNYYSQPLVAPQSQGAPQGYQNPSNQNTGFYNPQAPKWNPQTQQWEYPQGGVMPDPQQQQQSPPTQGGMTAPPPGHDTNGYQSPQAVQPPASRFAMPGWDNAKWNDPNNQDPKYVVGRILSNLPGRTDQMGAAVQRIAAAYPGTTQVGNGDISIPGVGVIDILMGAGAGGRGWWWGAGQAGGGASSGAGQQFPQPTQDPYADLIRTLMQPGGGMQPQVQQPAYDISKDPQYLKLQQQLASMQTQLQTAQTEQTAAGRGRRVNPSFAYY